MDTFAVNNNSFIGFKTHSVRGISSLIPEIETLTQTSEVTDLRGEFKTTTELKQYNLLLYAKHLSLYQRIRVVQTPDQGNFYCNRRKSLQKTTTSQNVELWNLVPMDIFLLLRFREPTCKAQGTL